MKTIPLTQGKVALVDDEDFERLSKYEWYYNGRDVYLKSTFTKMSHMVLQMSKQIDHIDRDTLNNLQSNLRPCTQSQNCQNRKKTKGKTRSKYKGVSPHFCKGWQAIIGFLDIFGQSAKRHLGNFCTEEEAARAYDRAARQYHREFAALNFPRKNEQSCL